MAELSSHAQGARAPRTVLAGIAFATALAHLALLDAVALPAGNPGPTPLRPVAIRVVEPTPPRGFEAQAPVAAVTREALVQPATVPPPVVAAAPVVAHPRASRRPARQAVAAPRPTRAPVDPPRAAPRPIRTAFIEAAAIETASNEAKPAGAALDTASIETGFVDTASIETPAPSAERLAAASPPPNRSDGAAGADEDLPVYATRIPSPFRFGYDMSRGMISGHGELALQIGPDGYEARLRGTVAGFSILDWSSRGGFDDAGFAPTRFVDQRRGRAAQAANFQRAAGRITYSGTRVEAPLPAGAQDRLSWMLQIAAIARARPERLVEGGRITMFVSGARGDADAWTFVVGPHMALETPAGPVKSVPLERAPRKEYDTRAQVWLDPARQYLPVKARLVSSREGADALELVLEEVQTPP